MDLVWFLMGSAWILHGAVLLSVRICIVNFWNLIAGIMEVGAEVVEAKEEDEEEEEKKEKKEKEKEGEGEGEGGQQNWSCGKKFPLLPCLVQVCYCYSGACKGGTLCGHVFLLFLIRV